MLPYHLANRNNNSVNPFSVPDPLAGEKYNNNEYKDIDALLEMDFYSECWDPVPFESCTDESADEL